MRMIKRIVIHCTAGSQFQTVEQIKAYWRNVLHWKKPGYHYIVKPDGAIEQLADDEDLTNGAKGFNADSLHVAYIGGIDAQGRAVDNRTDAQRVSLRKVVSALRSRYPHAVIVGHRDLSPDLNGNGRIDKHERIKECPCFDAIDEYNGMR